MLQSYPARAVHVFGIVGDWYVRQGQWKAAALTFGRLIDLNPADHLYYHALIPLAVQTGDLELYRRFCRRAVTLFGGIKDPHIAERMAKDCLVLPDTGVDLAVLSEWAETAVTLGQGSSDIRYFECTKGLAEYRRGHYASAAGWMQKSQHSGDSLLRIDACMVMAMAHHQLNQTDLARTELEEGLKRAAKDLPPISSDSLFENKDMHWADWIIAHALIGQAKALIEGHSDPATEKASESR